MKEEKKKIKILCFADSPRVSTGFGRVVHGIFKNLVKSGKYEVDIFGVNDLGFYNPDSDEYPYRILPAMVPGIAGDYHGRMRFVNVLRGADLFLKPSWDIVFTLNDPFIFEEPVVADNIGTMDAIMDLKNVFREKLDPKHWFKVVSYWPIDSSIKENWVEHAIGLPDYSVAYTQFGKEEIERVNNKLLHPMKLNLDIIYHGTNVKDFNIVSGREVMEFKKSFFQKAKIDIENTYIVGVVARNQPRKDLPRAMRVFKEFQKRRPQTMLYIHARESDVSGSLAEYARWFNLEVGRDIMWPGHFNEATGYPIKSLNLIYNLMDVQISTTQGEGWGLPLTEGMATKTLAIAPNITSIPEMFNTKGFNLDSLDDLETKEIRGIPVKAFSTNSEWATYGPSDFERIRPLTNIDDMAKKLVWVYDNPDKTKKIANRAYEWVRKYTWDIVSAQWDELLTKVYNQLEEERKNESNKSTSKSTDNEVVEQKTP
jgi:glycosyltransferase involved in cell wall biosynthesis